MTAVKPAGQGDYPEMERLYGVCHRTNRLSTILLDNNIIQFVQLFAPYDPKANETRLFPLREHDNLLKCEL